MKKIHTIFIAFLVIGGLFIASPASAIDIGESMPDFTLQDLDGKDVQLSSLMGSEEKPNSGTVLVFFNTSCGLCVKELRVLKSNLDMAKKDIIAIGIDISGPARIKKFWDRAKFGFPAYSDPEFASGQPLGFGFTPATAVFDGNGKLVKKILGYREGTEESLLELIK